MIVPLFRLRPLTLLLTYSEIAAITDALKWNVAKQRWLAGWQGSKRDANWAAQKGHRLRQYQAERVLEKMEVQLRAYSWYIDRGTFEITYE